MCKVFAGVGFGFGSLYLGTRTNLMWGSFNKTDRIFNIFITGFVGFISFLQFYAAFDVYKAQNLIPIDKSADQAIARRGLMYYFSTPDEKRELLRTSLDEDEFRLKIKKEIE
mmetsp:Transcript_14109/g.12460  ORF Transcript_14109/g.12460 Transcript_14109/m.12460 type:complete len:112 (+) Transcript_14109:176-511(+)